MTCLPCWLSTNYGGYLPHSCARWAVVRRDGLEVGVPCECPEQSCRRTAGTGPTPRVLFGKPLPVAPPVAETAEAAPEGGPRRSVTTQSG